MRVLHLSASDGAGGAARAAFRLHQGLRMAGCDSRMYVGLNKTGDLNVTSPSTNIAKAYALFRPHLDSLATFRYRNQQKKNYSAAVLPDGLASAVAKIDPDIVHLHWLGGGFLRPETLRRFRRPLIWTMHDMWPFTGGCHYDGNCGRYASRCGRCPVLGSDSDSDLSFRLWRRKKNAWSDVDITFVAPSRWLADCARRSSLIGDSRIEVVPNGLDLNTFRHIDKKLARELLGLSPDRKLILFGADRAIRDRRKGLELLYSGLRTLYAEWGRDGCELLVVGASEPISPPDIGFKCHLMGTLHDDISLVLLYSAADVFVAPSVQDNLPNTVMEAHACGTPCVAFDIGGMPDLIEHRTTGYLATPFDVEDLARGISWLLEDEARWKEISVRAGGKARNEFSIEIASRRYKELYQSM